MAEIRPEERLATVIAGLLRGCGHVAVGNSSPIPAAGALLARERGEGAERISLLGSRTHNPFTDGGRELFDCAAQGRIDAFFLSGGEIDGQGDINLLGIGDYPSLDVRFPGSFGSAFLYFAVPKVILFREEHSPRTLVERVSFVSAPGTSAPGTWRRGGPSHLVTGRCLFAFEGEGFRLESLHPGETLDGVRAATGFAFAAAPSVPATPDPDPETLRTLRGPVATALAETYPRFAARVFGVDGEGGDPVSVVGMRRDGPSAAIRPTDGRPKDGAR